MSLCIQRARSNLNAPTTHKVLILNDLFSIQPAPARFDVCRLYISSRQTPIAKRPNSEMLLKFNDLSGVYEKYPLGIKNIQLKREWSGRLRTIQKCALGNAVKPSVSIERFEEELLIAPTNGWCRTGQRKPTAYWIPIVYNRMPGLFLQMS